MIEHTTRGFDADLNELARKVKEMARLDEKQIKDAAEALEKRDTALARLVIAADDQVDALQREIEEKAVATIARRQPVAVSHERREVAAALEVWRKDQEVDALHTSLFRELLTYMMENPAI